MAGHIVYKGPSVIKEIVIGTVLGMVAGGFFKMYHWKEQRKTKEFYHLLNRGEITLVRDDLE